MVFHHTAAPMHCIMIRYVVLLVTILFTLFLSSIVHAGVIRLQWEVGNSTIQVVRLKIYRSVDNNSTYALYYDNTVQYFLSDRYSWVDTQVAEGVVYCYYMVSVDGNGNESKQSNKACGVAQ